MAVIETTVAGFPARLFRISFTGELGFEVNVPARHGRALWEKLWAGQQHDIVPYGTGSDARDAREKGFIIVGQDTDGTLTPTTPTSTGRSAGCPTSSASARSSAPTWWRPGSQAARRPADRRPEGRASGGRADRRRPEPAEADDHARPRHLVLLVGRPRPVDRHTAVVVDGRARTARPCTPMPAGTITAKVVKSTVFLDPENSRLSA